MEYAEDLEVDIPLLWKYLAEIMGPTAFDGNLNLDKLFNCVLKHVSKRKAAKLFAYLLETAANDTVSAVVTRSLLAMVVQRGDIAIQKFNVSKTTTPSSG